MCMYIKAYPVAYLYSCFQCIYKDRSIVMDDIYQFSFDYKTLHGIFNISHNIHHGKNY